MDGVAVELRGDVHRLESELHDSSYSTAEGHVPYVVAGCSPVSGDDWPAGEVPPLLHVVVDKPLQQELVYGRFIEIGMTRYRPVVVCQKPDRKMWRLHQCYHRGPEAEFSLAEIRRVSSSREHKSRADAPDHLALLRREEECRVQVTQAVDPCLLNGGVGWNGEWLVDDRHNPAGDEVPVLPHAQRDYWLDV